MQRLNIPGTISKHFSAPEIYLTGQGPAVDMWSVGCFFAELLDMLKENSPTFLDRQPLFTYTCLKQTGMRPGKFGDKQNCNPKTQDELNLSAIFDVIGTPEERDSIFIQDKNIL